MRRRLSTLPRRAPVKAQVRRNMRKEQKRKTPTFTKDWSSIRIISVGVVFTLLFLALGYRAFTLQIIKGPELAKAARRQHITTEFVTGSRGNIMDRNGNILARSVDSGSIWIDPSAITNKAKVADTLSPLLGISRDRLNQLMLQDRKFIWLARKVDSTVIAQVKKAAFRGVHIKQEYSRAYPYKTLAGQLLGFVDVDENGLEGLEKSFDNRLRGERIRQVVQRDAAGRRMVLPGSQELGDLRGRDLRLTLDANVQFFTEETLAEYVDMYGAKWGGALVIDVPTGEILAWAQYPYFDPNEHKKYSAEAKRNRLAMDALEQGSTMKSFLVAAALEEKLVSPETMINCEKGQWKIGKFTIHDTHVYGTLPVKKILHVSSNIGSAKIGRMLGAEKYHAYLSSLGFGARTGLPLSGEAKGILRPPKRWHDIDLATASFGQSFSATLVQMGQAYLHLANDGKRTPIKLLIESEDRQLSADGTYCEIDESMPKPNEKNEKAERIFSGKTMQELRAMLREVVEEEGGTGKHARIAGLEVGGKTGTAQKADSSGKYGKGRVGSFVGLVPIEKPRYLICVLLDEPTKNQYGGIIAAPVFRSVALNTMAYHGLLPDSDDPLVRKVVEKEAQRKNKNRGASKKTALVAQAAKQVIIANSVPISFDSSKETVPLVTGLSLQQAVEVIANYGVVPKIIGSGAIVGAQEPQPGVNWPAGKACTIWLQERTS